jgi:hypothetical protein
VAGSPAGSTVQQPKATSIDERFRAVEAQRDRQAKVHDLIAEHSPGGMMGVLRVRALAQKLLAGLPANATLVIEVVDAVVQAHKDDELAAELCRAASDQRLAEFARDPVGMRMLFRLVDAMQGVTTSNEGKAQLARAMSAIASARNPTGSRVEVEVITFDSGFAPLDFLGQAAFGKGARGHTALVVGGLVYSFDEHGWFMEGAKSAYMARNTHRDAVGQVLSVQPEDARLIQDRLNRSVGTGAYLLDGRVCADAAAEALERALGRVNAHKNPQRFKDDLAASGRVVHTNTYRRASAAPPAGAAPRAASPARP